MRVRSFLTIVAAAGTLVVAATAGASVARADEADQMTYLTFSGPVEVPGVVLPAGTYMFKLQDSTEASRDVVQVFNKSGSKLYSTFLAIPEERMKPSDKPAVILEKAAPGGPEAIKAWFYPDDVVGHEFVYPKAEARLIAQANPRSTHRAD
jgi:hypothetical protein